MKLVNANYEIVTCPDGEACLSRLEKICRIAYKSDDRIDPGIRHQDGIRWIKQPSSHKLIRSILKVDRRKKITANTARIIKNTVIELDAMRLPVQSAELAKQIVDMIFDKLRDDPPHESVIEHEFITVFFASNRGFTHELVRHRHAAFTQESTRYCNYSDGRFDGDITFIGRAQADLGSSEAFDTWFTALQSSRNSYLTLVECGVKAEIARDIASHALLAPIVITANLREWRHILRTRCSHKAHPDMRALMIPLRDELRKKIPIIFDEL